MAAVVAEQTGASSLMTANSLLVAAAVDDGMAESCNNGHNVVDTHDIADAVDTVGIDTAAARYSSTRTSCADP